MNEEQAQAIIDLLSEISSKLGDLSSNLNDNQEGIINLIKEANAHLGNLAE